MGDKGRLGCIEILKAKAAIVFHRFCMNKAQEEEEAQRKEKGSNERISYSRLLPLLFYSHTDGGGGSAQTDRDPFKLKSVCCSHLQYRTLIKL